jgi:putative MATE family efflux protein
MKNGINGNKGRKRNREELSNMASEAKMQDMTEGRPIKHILKFFVPLLFGMLFQQFYSLVDTAIVGKFLGSYDLAAVGATGSVNFLILGFCMGVCNGFAIPVAQKFGAKDEVGLRRFVANSVWLAAVFAVVMTVVVSLMCGKILEWMDTPADIMQRSYDYIFIIFLGIPVTYLYNLLSGIMRALGDSKTPLIFLIISSVLNIIFDIATILVFGLGVGGAAGATVLAQGISGVFCLLYMRKKFTILHISKEEWKLNGNCIAHLLSMGIPMGLQYSITAIGSVILQRAVNLLGSVAVAATASGGRISMFFCCPFDAMGSTMATYTGQNLGAGKLKRVDQGIFACSGIALVYSIIGFLILAFFGKYLALLFVDSSEVALIKMIAEFLWWNGLFYFPLALVNIVRFTIQGLGFGKLAILAGVCEMIARSVVGFYFVPVFGFTAACLAGPVAWILADMFLIPAYFLTIRHLKKKAEKS